MPLIPLFAKRSAVHWSRSPRAVTCKRTWVVVLFELSYGVGGLRRSLAANSSGGVIRPNLMSATVIRVPLVAVTTPE